MSCHSLSPLTHLYQPWWDEYQTCIILSSCPNTNNSLTSTSALISASIARPWMISCKNRKTAFLLMVWRGPKVTNIHTHTHPVNGQYTLEHSLSDDLSNQHMSIIITNYPITKIIISIFSIHSRASSHIYLPSNPPCKKNKHKGAWALSMAHSVNHHLLTHSINHPLLYALLTAF